MSAFSEGSLTKLRTCHPDLQTVFNEVVKHFDCTIVCGFRNKEDQDKAFADGKSQVQWPNGNHNKLPSLAVDVVPCPIDWDDEKQMIHFAGFVRGIAASKGIAIAWGGDWDRDFSLKDNRFNDYPHFELKEQA